MGKINCSSHACIFRYPIIISMVLHRPNEGFLEDMNEGFTGTEDEDVFSKYQIHIAERGTETHAEPDQVEEEAAAGEEAVCG